MPFGTMMPNRFTPPTSSNASSIVVAMICDDSGTRCDGFQTTVLPVTSALTTCAIGLAIGKLNGVMIPATPRGSRRLSMTRPSMFF